LAAASVLPAQWSSNPQRNTFVGSCPVPNPAAAGLLAIDPVTAPCNGGGCFFAWRDGSGRINIQVINDCGKPALTSPFLVAGTLDGGGVIAVRPTQLAGCAYADSDGARNQLFLAYTTWNSVTFREELWGNVFEFHASTATITPSTSPDLLHTATVGDALITPVADTSISTQGLNGVVNGAAVGWREWSLFNWTVSMRLACVTGPAATPAHAGVNVADAFTVFGAMPPRLSVISDHLGNVYGAWRGFDSSVGWYHRGTRVTSAGVAMAGWPTPVTPPFATTRIIDDWAIAADLQGGVFFAQTTDSSGDQMVVGHNDGAGDPAGWTGLSYFDSVPTGQPLHTLAMVGVDSAAAGTVRCALAYRDDAAIRLQEVQVTLGVLGIGASTVLQGVSPIASARGCAVLVDRGSAVGTAVVVGWTQHTGNSAPRRLWGQEVETTTWTTRWNSGAPRIVSETQDAAKGKFAPMVVSKYAMPEVIFAWIDERLQWLDKQGTPHPMTPGAYVQSVADDFLQFAGNGFKRVQGTLGSSVLCLDPIEHFDIHGATIVSGNPDDASNPGRGIGTELMLWDRDEGTHDLIKDLNPGPAGSNPSRTVALGSLRLFTATSAASGREPWVTDGTSSGTVQLADVEPGAGSSSPTWPEGLDQVGGAVLFVAQNSATGRELWRTDGTPRGTAMVIDLRPGSGNGVISSSICSVSGHAYFWGNDGVSGTELWRTDGTTAGTVRVTDLAPGSASANPGGMAALADRLVFGALLPALGSEPYVLDPATNAVTLLGDLNPGAGSSGPSFVTQVGSTVYFSAADANGRELWRTDGTPAGTVRVADIHPTGSSNPWHFTDAGGYVLFAADDGVHGQELWRTDGTAAGTALVADVLPGNGSGMPSAITAIGNGRAVFTVDDGTTGREPWVTDGTAAGTMRLADVNPGSAGANPQRYDVVAGTLFFDAVVDGMFKTMQLELSGPARFGQGCPGTSHRVPRIGSLGTVGLGQTLVVTLENALPMSVAGLVYNATSHPVRLGGCTVYVSLADAGVLLAPTDATGRATLAIPVPNDPALLGQTLYLQWLVVDPAGGLLGTLSLSDALRVTIE